MKEIRQAGVQYELEEFDKGIHSLNAFFTCYVDFEHSGKEINLSKLLKNDSESDNLAALYFGASANQQILLAGVQTKNLYRMVQFITEKNLWPTIKKKRRGLKLWKSKIETDKRFSDVVNAIDETKDPELVESLRSYPLWLFAIAYTAVGLKGHEFIMSLQSAEAGRIAYRDIAGRIKKVGGGFIKRIFVFAFFLITTYVVYKVLESGVLMTL